MASPLIAYCGLYCGGCSFQVAFETENRIHITKMPSYYDKYKNNELENCPGCRLEIKCGECKIRDCAIEKKVEWCGQCKEYPCDLIEKFINDGKPHHAESRKNTKLIAVLGERKWLEEMKKNYSCPKCGKKNSWYYRCECDK